jgi:hypothetical protein
VAERTLESIRADLEARGVAPELASRLAAPVARRSSVLDAGRYQAVIAGIALAVRMQGEEIARLRGAARELDEMQRLLGNFADELKKLDEALETLAAYVVRMRRPQAVVARRVLH